MAWNFVLTDLNYEPVGEILNASDRQVTLPLSKIDTMSFTVRLDNPLAEQLTACEGYIKGYRDGVLRYFGPIISAEEAGDTDSPTIAINSAGSGWQLTYRLAGRTGTGTIISTATDRALIARQAINDTVMTDQSPFYVGTGVAIIPRGTTVLPLNIATDGPISSASSITYTIGPFKAVMDIINELASAVDGFDWRIMPLENYSDGEVQSQSIGSFEAYPLLSTPRPDAVFEYGGGRNNIISYQRTTSRDTQANLVWHIASNGPADPVYPPAAALDGDSLATWGPMEAIAQGDILDAVVRRQLLNDNLTVRTNPRQVINFVPHLDPAQTGRVPYFGVDYTIGDLVPARAVYRDVVRFDAMLRVYQVAFAIDENGMERLTLTLAESS